MLIKILSIQIPRHWEIIKYVATTVDEVDQKDLQPYLNELLHALLSDKAQCFFRIGDKRMIDALCVTRILEDKIINEKYLQIQCVYGFKKGNEDTWRRDWDFLKEFAKNAGCSYMGFISRNKRIWDIGKIMGMEEAYRVYKFRL